MTDRPEEEKAIDLESLTLDELQRVPVGEHESIDPADESMTPELRRPHVSRRSDASQRELLNNSFPTDDELSR